MITARFGQVVVILLGLTLVPTIIHVYVGLTTDDGLTSGAISTSLVNLQSRPTSRRPASIQDTFDSTDWIERRYEKPGGGDLLLFVARSYDAKRLYHHPELGLVKGVDLRDRGTRRVPDMPDVPVHLLTGESEGRRDLVVYGLLYRDRFIDNPYIFQLRMAGELLFSRPWPMTLFFVHDPNSPAELPIERLPATRLLLDAIRSFLAQAQGGAPAHDKTTSEISSSRLGP